MIIDARNLVTNPQGQGGPQPMEGVIGITVHHTDGQQRIMSEAEERAVIKAIDFQHTRPPQDFGGFGYHGIAFASGRAYYCGDGQRAHVAKRNHQLRGYVFHGNFEHVMPSELQMSGMRELIMADRARFPQFLPVKGHDEWALTSDGTVCPGIVSPHDWEAELAIVPPNPQMPDGWVAVHNQVLCFNGDGEVVLAIGDWEGERPGQIAKLFGTEWLWLKKGRPRENGDFDAVWSPIKGD